MTLGTYDVACPNCGGELHCPVIVDGEVTSVTGQVEILIHAEIPEHTCPPPRSREPLPKAA